MAKLRKSFVTNSSSSSYIINTDLDLSAEEVRESITKQFTTYVKGKFKCNDDLIYNDLYESYNLNDILSNLLNPEYCLAAEDINDNIPTKITLSDPELFKNESDSDIIKYLNNIIDANGYKSAADEFRLITDQLYDLIQNGQLIVDVNHVAQSFDDIVSGYLGQFSKNLLRYDTIYSLYHDEAEGATLLERVNSRIANMEIPHEYIEIIREIMYSVIDRSTMDPLSSINIYTEDDIRASRYTYTNTNINISDYYNVSELINIDFNNKVTRANNLAYQNNANLQYIKYHKAWIFLVLLDALTGLDGKFTNRPIYTIYNDNLPDDLYMEDILDNITELKNYEEFGC